MFFKNIKNNSRLQLFVLFVGKINDKEDERVFKVKSMGNKREKKSEKSFNEKEYYRLGINIAAIRKAHGETQEQLALSINVSKSAICNYETGQRIPNRDELNAIAKHYNITVPRLMYGDFSKLSYDNLNDILVTDSSNQAISIACLLPIVCSERAMKNKYFRKAYNMQLDARELLTSEDTDKSFIVKIIDECNDLYQKAADNGIYEAYANMLWWPFIILISTLSLPMSPNDFIENVPPNATFKEAYASFMADYDSEVDKEWEKEKKELLDFYRPDIWLNLAYLRASGEWESYEVAEYYIALGYIFNILRPELNAAESRMIGHEMMVACLILQNEYAKDFHSLYKLY